MQNKSFSELRTLLLDLGRASELSLLQANMDGDFVSMLEIIRSTKTAMFSVLNQMDAKAALNEDYQVLDNLTNYIMRLNERRDLKESNIKTKLKKETA